MLTFDMGPLAARLGCESEVAAYTGPFVGWRFFGAVLREKPDADAETKAVVDPVIAGIDALARGEDWPLAEAWAASDAAKALVESEEWAVWVAEWAAAAAAHSAHSAQFAAEAAAEAAGYAAAGGLPYARQRAILIELMEVSADE